MIYLCRIDWWLFSALRGNNVVVIMLFPPIDFREIYMVKKSMTVLVNKISKVRSVIMKQQNLRFPIAVILGMVIVSGCNSREGYRAYESTEINNNGTVENRLVEEYVSPDHKRVVSKQIAREKIQCVGKDGRPLPVKSVSDCMKRKGKLVDEVYQEEKIITSK